MTQRYLGVSIAALLLSLAACSSDESSAPRKPRTDDDQATAADDDAADDAADDDADNDVSRPSTGKDSGAGVKPMDGGRAGADAGRSMSDAARTSSDAGAKSDASRADDDAGSIDAGSASSDAGGAADAGSDSADAGPSGDAGASPDAGPSSDAGSAGFEACTQALKPKCAYDDLEMGCASYMTPSIPLTGGGTWGNTELKQGPYGSYVEWNEGKAFANRESLLENACDLAASSFGEPESVTADTLDLRGQDLKLYTVFRPACWKEGEKYPVITWGNGTCGQAGSYGGLLATVASHGFVVFAPNSRWVAQGNNEMLKALDFAKAVNEDPTSIYYQRLDLTKVGAMGHSQGAGATATAASDPRIKAVILWNAGTSAVKPFLAVSGDRDVTGYTPTSMASDVRGASQPGAWLYYHKVLETGGSSTGHLTLMEQPDRVVEPAVAWWKYMLNGDQEAKKLFVGTDCGLCNKAADYEFGQRGLD